MKVIFRHYGAKVTLAKQIISHFPVHRVYVEPFCGSAAILFQKPPSFIEVINDIDKEILELFRALRQDPFLLAAALWASPYSQADYREQIRTSDIDKSAAFIANSVQKYCGDANTSTWAIDGTSKPHKPKAKVLADWYQRILPAAARLKDVTLLCEDAIKCIDRFKDDPDVLLYVDPPYKGHEREFKFKVNYQEMVDRLSSAKASVVVSEYASARIFFPEFKEIAIKATGRARVGAHRSKAKTNPEVLFIKNAAK